MKKHTVVLAIAALMLATSLPFAAKAQDPFKNLTKNDVVATFKVPDIVDFVTYFLNDPIDEQRESVATEWQKYLKNEKLGKGVSFVVDKKNGYIRYEKDCDVAYPDYKNGEKEIVEYC